MTSKQINPECPDKSGSECDNSDRTMIQDLTDRRTISRFKSDPVDQQLILDAVEVARWAPNHHLTEPWHFYLLGEQARAATIERIYELASAAKGHSMGKRKANRARKIPFWVVVTSRRSDDPVLHREDFAATSCAIHNFSLFLWHHGVGMKWCTGALVDDAEYFKRLNIDQDAEEIVGVLRIGYPRTVPRQKRKPVDKISTRLK